MRVLSFYFLVLTFAIAQLSFAETTDDGDLTFCNFGPKITVVNSGVHHSSDPCADRVHIQGASWQCGSAENVTALETRFLDDLNKNAREECEKHCKNIGSECQAIYSNTPTCGLVTDREKAVALGKQFGCRKDCSGGTAFAYCSIYNAGYLGKGTEAIQDNPINCECRSN